jgi:hypothetical protein
VIEFGPSLHAELLVCGMELVLHRAVGQGQACRDLSVGQTRGCEACDLQFPRGERNPCRDGGGQRRRSGTLAAIGQRA